MITDAVDGMSVGNGCRWKLIKDDYERLNMRFASLYSHCSEVGLFGAMLRRSVMALQLLVKRRCANVIWPLYA